MLEDILIDKMSKLESYFINCAQEPNNNLKVSFINNNTHLLNYKMNMIY